MEYYRRCFYAMLISDRVRLTVAALQKVWLNLSKEERTEFGEMEMKLCEIYGLEEEPTNFIALRVQALSMEIRYRTKLRHMLTVAFENHKIASKDYENAIKSASSHLQRVAICVLKRQGNTVAGDLDNMLHTDSDIKSVYAFLLVKEIHSTISKQKYLRYSDRHNFQTEVGNWYDARRPIFASRSYEGYCHVTGEWLSISKIRAVHIVSKSLQGDEIDYLFGHGKVDLSDPSNGLTLVKWIKIALEESKIIIVPEESRTELSWKVLVADETLLKLKAPEGDQWRAIDGKLLKFLNENRPAIPFLYFRYLISYFKCRKEGHTKWTKKFDIYKWGRIWASPGPYVRRSVLEGLIKEMSDYSQQLPVAFTTNITFTGEPRRLPAREKVLSLSLAVLLENEATWVEERKEDENKKKLTFSLENEQDDETFHSADESE